MKARVFGDVGRPRGSIIPGERGAAGATTANNALCSRRGRQSFPNRSSKRGLKQSASSLTPSMSLTDDRQMECRDLNDFIRQGGSERRWLVKQANKRDPEQPSIASILSPIGSSNKDVIVVGCGPAGLALSCELAERGLSVGLVGPDTPFVNTYGVWEDEFVELGLGDCLELVFEDAVCHFGDSEKGCVRVGRKYARVDRAKLRGHLLDRCQKAGVGFQEGHVVDVSREEGGDKGSLAKLQCKTGDTFKSSVAVLASGAVSSKFLKYEEGVPHAGAQTAYGFEVEIDQYPFSKSLMHFMDFRRHHTGLWEGKALHPEVTRYLEEEGSWGVSKEMPSFLYAMPLGGNKAFFQETCLVSKQAVPFHVLERRLKGRLDALGVKVKSVLDEEWSYIPVGGPLPLADQQILAFGAAANMIHPASGYSISRSLRAAPAFAKSIVDIFEEQKGWNEVSSKKAWDTLWTARNRKQAAFHTFGMELLALLDVRSIDDFFLSFFKLPDFLWRGFLAAELDAGQIIFFALSVFVICPFQMKGRLVGHLFGSEVGRHVIEKFISSESPDAIQSAN
eukprot:CAMPEP_0198235352 /NCGR_PEP_ID=MMETSP1446-20131203/1261_1 /TAXON_ID=1461542 ORGANISM="Unidentified sp, Strain CCMP2111" /NCGR_SAMPLE_ID=MMETSP1446 /ASSEMBLY_ACC=CAM_ASM_001112 /LENGTH=562 /DNA_ID=CAMNT_0043916489 /DNA_START=190 /DNA_END=1878 /DNA_ORIENTATION=+